MRLFSTDRWGARLSEKYKIAIVGSGPAGLSAAGRAAALDKGSEPSYVLLEKRGQPSETIFRFQKGKHVMAEPGYLKLRSDLPFDAGKRERVLGAWNERIEENSLNLRLNSDVTGVTGSRGDFTVQLAGGETVSTETVVFAVGVQGNPRTMNVPGETSEWVQYQLDDPDEYKEEKILVVGAGDAAVENALALAAHNDVTILNRRDEFARVKDGNHTALLAAINDEDVGLSCRYNTNVKEVSEEGADDARLLVTLITPEGDAQISVDRIIARLGSLPPRGFLEHCGIEFPGDSPNALPEVSETYESNIPGLYIVGALAGYPLIKQAMNQGYDVVEFISGNEIKPADHELLEYQFRGLPYGFDVDTQLKMMIQRVPMLQQLNGLAVRELVIESRIYAVYSDPETARVITEEMQGLKDKIEELYAGERSRPRATRIVELDQVIYERGDRGVSFFTIIDGEVKLESPDTPGGYRILKQGEFFGEMSLLAGQARRETARAGRDCVLMETPRRTILKIMNSNPAVREGIVWMYAVRELQRHFAPKATFEQLRSLAELVTQRTFTPGEVLWQLGDPAESVHIVQNGTVAMMKSRDEEQVVVAQVRAGQLIGQMSVFGDATRDETAVASVFTETFEIDRELFGQLMRIDPGHVGHVQDHTAQDLVSRAVWEIHPESSGLLGFLLDDGLGEATNALFIDESLCIGCDNCETACAETHGGISRLQRKAGKTYETVHVPISCRHCEQPHCMKDCPPNAINRSSTGEVYIDDTCIGCGNCVANCPYDAISLAYPPPEKPGLLRWILFGSGPGPGEHPEKVEGGSEPAKAVKCDACFEEAGGPACVRACPTGAAFRIGPNPVNEIIERTS